MEKNIEDLVSIEIAKHDCLMAVADYAMMINIANVVLLVVLSSISTACYHLDWGDPAFWIGIVTAGIIGATVIFIVSRILVAGLLHEKSNSN